MARVPITIMGFRCERCEHEWLPRIPSRLPAVCPKCKSPYWNRPRKAPDYPEFKSKVEATLRNAGPDGLTWTEVRMQGGLSQAFPNNQWVRRLEEDIALERRRDAHGIIHWRLG